MKKQFKSVAATVGALMMLSGSAFAAMPASAANKKLMGDLDGDLKVTIDDALTAAQISSDAISKIASNTINQDNYAADIDMNGEVDLDDAVSILQYYTTSLLGGELLWADLRKTSYHDGTKQNVRGYYDDETDSWHDEWIELDSTPFVLKDLYVEIGCAEGKPGEEVTVPVFVAGCDALVGFQYVQDVPGDLTVTNMTTPLLKENIDENPEHEDAFAWNPEFNVGGKNCTLIWVNYNGLNIDISDGTIITEITYKIPEDAKSGDCYILSDSSNVTMFLRNQVNPDTLEELDPQDFQYTLIDGVIRVK